MFDASQLAANMYKSIDFGNLGNNHGIRNLATETGWLGGLRQLTELDRDKTLAGAATSKTNLSIRGIQPADEQSLTFRGDAVHVFVQLTCKRVHSGLQPGRKSLKGGVLKLIESIPPVYTLATFLWPDMHTPAPTYRSALHMHNVCAQYMSVKKEKHNDLQQSRV